ncbi:MAG: hypothetical protein SFV54_12555 [Bryobacteraceae bacterium]|nr:hypothetical protein [Bryobacteraceae bacterium]
MLSAFLTSALLLAPAWQSALDARYPGWKLAPVAPQIAAWFKEYGLGWEPNLVRADFDRDGREDFALQIVAGGRQRVIAVMADGTLHELAADPADSFTFLMLHRRGEKDFDFERMKPFRYAADSLGLLYFSKTAVTYEWRARAKKFASRNTPGDEEAELSR